VAVDEATRAGPVHFPDHVHKEFPPVNGHHERAGTSQIL